MGVPWETVTLTAFGRNKSIYSDMLEEGKNIFTIQKYIIILLCIIILFSQVDGIKAK